MPVATELRISLLVVFGITVKQFFRKLIVEYYDSRSCLTALRALNDRSFGTGRLTAVLAWDYPRQYTKPVFLRK